MIYWQQFGLTMNTNSNTSIVLADVVSSSIVPFDVVSTSMALSTDNHRSPVPQAPAGELNGVSNGPVAILWDIENCRIPCDTRAEDVASNIRMALRINPMINGAVTMFNAYGDFNAFPKRLREGCQRTGVKLIDVPNGRKDAADKAILIDMFLFALDNAPPSSIVLISGDVDFAPALHILGQRGYTVVLLVPSGVGVSPALSNAGRFVWDWPSVARGEGFMPSPSAMPLRADLPIYMQAGFSRYGQEPQIEEESIVYRGTSLTAFSHSNVNQSSCFDSTQVSRRDFSGVSHSLSEYNNNSVIGLSSSNPKSNNLSSAIYNADEGNRKSYHSWWVQPGDVPALKQQLVKLLELSNGSIQLIRLPPEYHKLFGRQLHVQEYGESKLVNLLSKMNDVLTVEGRCSGRSVCLRKTAGQPKKVAVKIGKKDKREKISPEERSKCIDVVCQVNVSSDEEKIKETHVVKVESPDATSSEAEEYLDNLRFELQELLVSHNCKILFGIFEALYEQRYKKILDYGSFGVDNMEELLAKVGDVVALHDDEKSGKKFVVAR